MVILRSVLLAVEALCCLLLIALVLIQKSKSEGLGLAFGTGMGETLFGSRAGNVLTKATVVLTILFLANTLLLAVIIAGQRDSSLIEQSAGPITAPAPAAPGELPPGVEPGAANPAPLGIPDDTGQ
ncbi:MAG: preprotein translocase subunit SecG [Verrucomicrobia bacterium]|nr:preprotein translocase subunit SecG [Verrucomicrobiota bacterium]